MNNNKLTLKEILLTMGFILFVTSIDSTTEILFTAIGI